MLAASSAQGSKGREGKGTEVGACSAKGIFLQIITCLLLSFLLLLRSEEKGIEGIASLLLRLRLLVHRSVAEGKWLEPLWCCFGASQCTNTQIVLWCSGAAANIPSQPMLLVKTKQPIKNNTLRLELVEQLCGLCGR